jgi:hypothetical protein
MVTMPRNRKLKPGLVERPVTARRAGLTLRQAANAAGVHVATVCRWQARDQALHEELAEAATEAKAERLPQGPRPRVVYQFD